MWISVFEKTEFLRNIWFSGYQFNQIKKPTNLNFSKLDIRDDMTVSVYLV